MLPLNGSCTVTCDGEVFELSGRASVFSGVSDLVYVPRDSEIWIYTYAKSQKVRNLERDPRATLLAETGHEYGELRGIEIEAEGEVHRDLDTVFELAQALTMRYAGEGATMDDAGVY